MTLSSELSKSNVADLLRLANKHDGNFLKKAAAEFIRKNFNQISNLKTFSKEEYHELLILTFNFINDDK
jgi:hypothetical protein